MATVRRKDLSAVNKDGVADHFVAHHIVGEQDDEHLIYIIGIKHDFPFINMRKVPREVLKTKGEARGFQHLPRDLANVNEW